jgi:hypothetical protein
MFSAAPLQFGPVKIKKYAAFAVLPSHEMLPPATKTHWKLCTYASLSRLQA